MVIICVPFLTDFVPTRVHPVLGATQLEVGEGAVYEAAIVAEHAGAGTMVCSSCLT